MSRVVGAEWLLDDVAKELLRKQMWALAEYCGMEIVTYALMSNHYHILLRVPERRSVGDAELLGLYRRLHPNLKPHQELALRVVEQDMASNGDLAQRWREQQQRQMFDVSIFNKLLKMRFSIWYNRTHKRIGTFWAERFKSVLVESGDALEEMAAYIDLNAVRAKMVSDPKDYRFCGYAEAVAGNPRARQGLMLVHNEDWQRESESYRCALLGRMRDIQETEESDDQETSTEPLATKGRLPLRAKLGCRIRYFADGVILGSELFVREKAKAMPGERKRGPRILEFSTGIVGLNILDRLLRQSPATTG
jgi:REP element-mobilizing transposase RayT